MKIYEQIQQNLDNNQISVLYSEWDIDSEGNVKDLIQRVETKVPEMVKSRIEAEVFETGKPVVSSMDGHWYMAEPFFPQSRLIVLGGGHVALPVVEFAAKTGFAVTVVDDREEFANAERFPWAEKVVCEKFEAAVKQLAINKNDYVCIITRGHAFDEICLRAVLAGELPGYMGMIGSRRHVAMVKDAMRLDGVPEEVLDRLHSPIGLSIGAISPAEIAISILSELIMVRRLGDDKSSFKTSMDQDYNVVSKLAGGSERRRAVLTIVSAFGSSPRGAGAKMIVYEDGSILGSIGGGGGEALAIKKALEIIGTGKTVISKMDLTQDAAAAEGLVCGGTIEVLIQDDTE